jgi:calcium-dependent protein kinase
LPAVEDEVELALVSARRELEKSEGRQFSQFYRIDKLVGHGAFAKVLSCTELATGQQRAVKIVKKDSDCGKQREGIVKEVAIMRVLQGHPNSIQLQEVFEDDDSYCIVMELCSGGELFDQVRGRGCKQQSMGS